MTDVCSPNSIIGEESKTQKVTREIGDIISKLRELPGSPKIAPVGNWVGSSGNSTPPIKGEGLWF